LVTHLGSNNLGSVANRDPNFICQLHFSMTSEVLQQENPLVYSRAFANIGLAFMKRMDFCMMNFTHPLMWTVTSRFQIEVVKVMLGSKVFHRSRFANLVLFMTDMLLANKIFFVPDPRCLKLFLTIRISE
jgi:hypothetical protein